MSEQAAADAARVPRWDIADRMRKALRTADVSIEEMADYLEVSRRSVGNWINGRADPGAKYVRLWALRTGVAYEWLCHGDLNPCDLRPRGVPRDVSPGQGGSRRRGYSMQSNLTFLAA